MIGFWSGKRVLITGHTGFKGSWLSLLLQRLGAQITGFALPPEPTSLFNLATIKDGMKSVLGDIRDFEQLHAVTKSCRPEIVIHLAAQALVRQGYEHPVETFEANIMGTVNMLEACRMVDSVKVIINVTSDKCYENKGVKQKFKETDPMGGSDPYSCSKGCAELVTNSFRRSFFANNKVELASVRAGNVIGGGDFGQDRLVPDIFKAIGAGKPVLIRNPSAVRPWQHVCEPLQGYIMLAEQLWESGQKYAGGWNFGPEEDDTKPVSWITDYICHRWGKGAQWRQDESNNPAEAEHLALDNTKAKTELGWKPQLGLSTALDWSVSWFAAYHQKKEMREVTEQQITKYQNMCNNEP